MKQFKVLDRNLELHRNYLLQASAGTGKTFAIQNIVVRLLMTPVEPAPLSIDQILVVTFTRAAAGELKTRIRSHIEEALRLLHRNHKKNEDSESNHPVSDYLQSILEQGDEAINLAISRLQEAIFNFDKAQIFTIHSFCARILKHSIFEADLGLHARKDEERGIPASELLFFIENFLLSWAQPARYSPLQLEIILKYDPDHRLLLQALAKPYLFEPLPGFQELMHAFQAVMHQLKRELKLTSKQIRADYEIQADAYYKGKEKKADVAAKIPRFAALFDQEEWTERDFEYLLEDGLVWIDAFQPSQLKPKKSPPAPLHYPSLFCRLHETLYPIIEQARNPELLMSRLAGECQRAFHAYQKQEERLSPDDLLKKTEQALQDSRFRARIQKLYGAAIIDEFQDTDPTQWEIFRTLFLKEKTEWNGLLYLVGDPKQSIYSFRSADIYTYLKAAQMLGAEACYSLDVNYRSQPNLVEALNLLFADAHLPHFIPLPKIDRSLSCPPVKAAFTSQKEPFQIDKGAVHFIIADRRMHKRAHLKEIEAELFFPFFVQEIERLHTQKNSAYRDIACLVRDRHQALRLASYLERYKIPYVNQRGIQLIDSPVLPALKDLMEAILDPGNHSKGKKALGGLLIGWSYGQLCHSTPQELEAPFMLMSKLKESLVKEKPAVFFEKLMRSPWPPANDTMQKHLLQMEGGENLYRDLEQVFALLTTHTHKHGNHPLEILHFLDQLPTLVQDEDPSIKKLAPKETDGIHILTLHASKGLEFEVVFALGLVQRSKSQYEEWIPVERAGKIFLIPAGQDKKEYFHYCEENDAEKMRQLYVALTRAKAQLYVPHILWPASQVAHYGEASPIELFAAKLHQPDNDYAQLYERMGQQQGTALLDLLKKEGKLPWITYEVETVFKKTEPSCPEKTPNNEKLTPQQILFPPKPIVLHHSPIWVHSFTSLQTTYNGAAQQPSAPFDFEAACKTRHTLPAGTETGILIHHILEKISFERFQHLLSPKEALPFIRPFIAKTAFAPWEEVIAELIFYTLQTDLKIGAAPFRLADLKEGNFFREMPFLYQNESKNQNLDLVQGVIDLVFQEAGSYYIVDWKTNWLGPNEEAYEPTALAMAMEQHNYRLQSSLYTEALHRYLALMDPRPFADCFGGALYIFVRGHAIYTHRE